MQKMPFFVVVWLCKNSNLSDVLIWCWEMVDLLQCARWNG